MKHIKRWKFKNVWNNITWIGDVIVFWALATEPIGCNYGNFINFVFFSQFCVCLVFRMLLSLPFSIHTSRLDKFIHFFGISFRQHLSIFVTYCFLFSRLKFSLERHFDGINASQVSNIFYSHSFTPTTNIKRTFTRMKLCIVVSSVAAGDFRIYDGTISVFYKDLVIVLYSYT